MPEAALPCKDCLAASLAGAAGGASGNVAERDATLAEVVGRHFQRDFVAGEDTNVVLAHFAACVRDYGMTVIERYAKAGVGQDFSNETAHFNQFFFGHVGFL